MQIMITASFYLSEHIVTMYSTNELILHYGLDPHPEGGWYKQTYGSKETIPAAALPERFEGDRVFATAIYFLLEQGNFSAFHRIKSDECWHFYTGDPLEVLVLQPGGKLDIITLGNDIRNGQLFQYVVPANCWFASRLAPLSVAAGLPQVILKLSEGGAAPGSRYSLVGCTVAPGFDFADFELADAAALTAQYPQHAMLIQELCR